jgi:hypothetical protein
MGNNSRSPLNVTLGDRPDGINAKREHVRTCCFLSEFSPVLIYSATGNGKAVAVLN